MEREEIVHCPQCGAVCRLIESDGQERHQPIGDTALFRAYQMACERIAKLEAAIRSVLEMTK